ncbi:MAG: hypothetical protein HZC26_01950 [Candidatus Magasanikbacteria bacterium]|nr:hypothetical protein [Candidatus Magasanikbacteria bacterium]
MNKFFDQAIQKQTEAITGQLGEIKKLEEFEQFNKKFEGMGQEMKSGVMNTLNQKSQNFQQKFNSKQEFIQDLKIQSPEVVGQGAAGGQAPNAINPSKENFKEDLQEQPQKNNFAPKPMMPQASPAPQNFQNSEPKPQPVNEFKPEIQINQVKEPMMVQPTNNNMNGGFEKPGAFQQNSAPQQVQQPLSPPQGTSGAPAPQPINN